jgi:hypothetical protein
MNEIKNSGAKLVLIENETGEILSEKDISDYEGVSVKVTSKKSKDYLKRKEEERYEMITRVNERASVKKEFGEFVFSVLKGDMLHLLQMNIPEYHISKIFYLSSFVEDDGYIKSNGVKLKRSEVVKLLNIGKNTATRFMNSMINIGIISVNNNKNVKISKDFFIKGAISKEYKGSKFIKVFNEAIRELYHYLGESTISNKRKYLAFYHAMALIPFINQQDSALRHKDGELVTIGHIVDMLGIDSWKYRRFTDSLSDVKFKNGEPFVKLVIDSTRAEDVLNGSIAINPRFMYNGNSNKMWEKHKNYIEIQTE